VPIDAVEEEFTASLDFRHSFLLSFARPFSLTETQSHGKLSAKNTAYRSDAADDATGGGVL